MALSGAIPVSNEQVFPDGAWMEGDVRPVKDFKLSTPKTDTEPAKEVQQVQRDADDNPVTDDAGNPIRIWEVDIYDNDPKAFDKRTKVKIYSARQPVPPEGLEGAPFRLVEFENLAVQPWVNQAPCNSFSKQGHKCRARQGFSYRATGIRAPSSKPAQQRQAKASAGNGQS